MLKIRDTNDKNGWFDIGGDITLNDRKVKEYCNGPWIHLRG